MIKEEVARVIRKIETVRGWFFVATGEEYTVSSIKAQELIEQLEEVDKNGKE